MSRAVVIQSGGGNGAYAGHALATLEAQGFTYDALFGCSVGGVIAHLAATIGIKAGMQAWDSEITGFLNVFFPNLLVPDDAGLFSISPLQKILEKYTKGVKASKPYTVSMVDWDYGVLHHVPLQDHANPIGAVLAGCSIPLLVNPYPNTGILDDGSVTELMDGGGGEDTPLQEAMNQGFDEILVIMCQPNRAPMCQFTELSALWPGPLFDMIRLAQRAMRTLDIKMHTAMLADLKAAALYKGKVSILSPLVSAGNVLDFSTPANAKRAAQGISDAQAWAGF